MRIGLDFDNTIVSYDALFHAVALERQLIGPDTPVSKIAVRDHLRSTGREPLWTEMQGYVYGARMEQAQAYPGLLQFVDAAHAQGVELVIISHKTRHPFAGPAYDLHAAAAAWIDRTLAGRIAQRYFELTKEEKIARIASCGCDYFIDDLPEILAMPGFPSTTAAILFDPDGAHQQVRAHARLEHWDEVLTFFQQRW